MNQSQQYIVLVLEMGTPELEAWTVACAFDEVLAGLDLYRARS